MTAVRSYLSSHISKLPAGLVGRIPRLVGVLLPLWKSQHASQEAEVILRGSIVKRKPENLQIEKPYEDGKALLSPVYKSQSL